MRGSLSTTYRNIHIPIKIKLYKRQSWDGFSDAKFSSQAKIYNLYIDHIEAFLFLCEDRKSKFQNTKYFLDVKDVELR